MIDSLVPKWEGGHLVVSESPHEPWIVIDKIPEEEVVAWALEVDVYKDDLVVRLLGDYVSVEARIPSFKTHFPARRIASKWLGALATGGRLTIHDNDDREQHLIPRPIVLRRIKEIQRELQEAATLSPEPLEWKEGGIREECLYCYGIGFAECEDPSHRGLLWHCPRCHGEGKILNRSTEKIEQCYLCNGKGRALCGECGGDGVFPPWEDEEEDEEASLS